MRLPLLNKYIIHIHNRPCLLIYTIQQNADKTLLQNIYRKQQYNEQVNI